jgi:hypothetical protein
MCGIRELQRTGQDKYRASMMAIITIVIDITALRLLLGLMLMSVMAEMLG